MAKILIKNGRVFNGESFAFCDVLTDGKIISRIDQNITDDAEFGGNIVLHLAVLSEEYEAFEKAVYSMTNGKITPAKKGTRLDV